MIRILHVASFVGNIGDNASTMGLYNLFDEIIKSYSVEKLEIRRFYKKYRFDDKKRFDRDFINYANTFDLLIIGGGGFLDYWVENSATGTTIDIEPDLIQYISTPTMICSVGAKPHHKIPEGNIEKFQKFLDAVEVNEKVMIAIRNDGSKLSFLKYIGQHYLKQIPEVLDHGFYYSNNTTLPLPINDNYVTINITIDQIKMISDECGAISENSYYNNLKKVIEHLCLNMKQHVVLMPHVYHDLKAFSKLLDLLDDFLIKNYITVAPCIQNDIGADYLYSIYKNSKLVMGTRFHANVCALAMKTPTIGLAVLDRVKYLYDQMGLSDDYVFVDNDFADELIKKIELKLSCEKPINEEYLINLEKMKHHSIKEYCIFLEKNGIGTNI